MKDNSTIFSLVTEAFGGRGGIAQYNRDLFDALVRAGSWRLTVLPRIAPEANSPRPQGIEEMPARFGRVAYGLKALFTVLTRPVDVIFCGHLYMAPLALIAARLARAKLVIQLHGIEAWTRPSKLTRAAVESANVVLCVSRFTRARVLDWASVVPERVLVVPNTVGDAFTPGPASGFDGKRVLLTVGRMDACERYKGHDRVIAAIPTLVARGYDVVYVLAGEGNDIDQLCHFARELGVADRVQFVGAVDTDALIGLYRRADLFVMPSKGEGFGIVYVEAMACGTSALGLAEAGTSDALGDGELGVMVAERDLAQAIAAQLDMGKPDANALSAAVRARFGRDVFAARAARIFGELSEAA